MKAIMDTLQERHANWQGARELAANDPTIDLENNTHDVNPYSVSQPFSHLLPGVMQLINPRMTQKTTKNRRPR